MLRRLVVDAPLRSHDLLVLAGLAGLALNSRVLEGIGLYLAMAWILLLTLRGGGVRKVIVPAAILMAFVVICGSVNYLRWGSPLTFMDLRLHIEFMGHPKRVARLDDFGTLNLLRLPFSFSYYFLGATDLNELQLYFPRLKNLYDGVEGPSSAFLQTTIVPLLFALLGVSRVFRRKSLRSSSGALLSGVLVAQIVSIGLLLTANYLAMRYRMDFLPALSFAAALGYLALTTTTILSRRIVTGALLVTLVSIVASSVSLVQYKEEIQPSKAEAKQFWEHYQSTRSTPSPRIGP